MNKPIQIPEEDMYCCFQNPDNEEQIVRGIKTYLLSKEDRKILFDHNKSIEDLLNGRFADDPWVEEMFSRWNEKLGLNHFHF